MFPNSNKFIFPLSIWLQLIFFVKCQDAIQKDFINVGPFKPHTIFSVSNQSNSQTVVRFLYGNFFPSRFCFIENEFEDYSHFQRMHSKFRYLVKNLIRSEVKLSFTHNDFANFVNEKIDDFDIGMRLQMSLHKHGKNRQNYNVILQIDKISHFRSFGKSKIIFAFYVGLESFTNEFSGRFLKIENSSIRVVGEDNQEIGFFYFEHDIDSDIEIAVEEFCVVPHLQFRHVEKHVKKKFESFFKEEYCKQERKEKKEKNQRSGSSFIVYFKINEPALVEKKRIYLRYFSHEEKFPEPFDLKSLVSELKKNATLSFSSKFPVSKSESKLQKCSRHSFSNLISGYLFSHGSVKVFQRGNTPNMDLFTMTPSRGYFPRGFLWDEGFHQLINCVYSQEVCMLTIENWFDTQEPEGWIPREQIRGMETEEHAHKDYIVQYPKEGNPPSLLFPIMYLFKQNNENVKKFLTRIYPKIVKWFNWFYENQNVDDLFLFKWHSVNEPEYLGSGLDDYPRGNAPHVISKFHLDLHCWMAYFARCLYHISGKFDRKSQKRFKAIFQEILDNLAKYFEDPDGLLKDMFTNITTNEEFLSQHEGYVNLFPLIFGLINSKSNSFFQILRLVQDTSKLWTDFGLRSLSQQDIFFSKKNNYWTGPIWININFLVLRGLKLYYSDHLEAGRIYDELRENVINTVCGNWEIFGYFFETYNEFNGKGTNNHPFNGWTSLVTLIISEIY